MKLEIVDITKGDVVGNLDYDDALLLEDNREDILARVVKWQLAKRRSGCHKVKTRSEVNHTTRKPFKQKGTGSARQGMKGVSQMRGGGVVFGPVVRSHEHSLPKKVRKLGLKLALSGKAKQSKLKFFEAQTLENLKTKDIKVALDKLDAKKVLIISDNNDKFVSLKKIVGNIVNVNTLPTEGMNVYDMLNHDLVLVCKDSLPSVMERVK